MTQEQLLDDKERLKQSLSPIPEAFAKPILVLVIGLPGTGKSFLSRRLAERFPFLILETDALRRVLVQQPQYSAEENARLFRACHAIIEELLERGIPIIFDATNLVEHHRERLYHIVEQNKGKLILIRVKASSETVRERLNKRLEKVTPEDHSTADWTTYQRMRSSVEAIPRNHFVVDTTKDIIPVIEKIVRGIRKWLRE
ncbi:MAG: ATP-binding protein [Chloroflexi bacterium]|nr:ATP-binding protein [Chloroflexota bacterium]